jgi:DNA-binding transcriptional LysR family regulator
MDLVLAESLVAVADSGSITEAAGRVHVSQSALSRRLQQLEAEMGVQLLSRGRHGAVLTEAGRLVASDCRDLLVRYAGMRRRVDELKGLRRGEIVLGGGATATSVIFPAAIAAFRSAHPDIRFILTEAGSSQVVGDVAGGRVQLGLVTLPVSDPEVGCEALVEDEIVLVARSDDHLDDVVGAADLRGRGIIAFEAGTAVRRIVDTALARVGAEVEVTMELRSVTTMLQMVAATGDLAFVSRLALGGHPGLRSVAVRRLRVNRTLAVATRRGVAPGPAGEAFLTTLRHTAAALSTPGQQLG